MRAPNLTKADPYGGGQHAVRREGMQQKANGGDIGDGVQLADLVKMDLPDRSAVRLAFRRGEQALNGQHIFPNGVGQL